MAEGTVRFGRIVDEGMTVITVRAAEGTKYDSRLDQDRVMMTEGARRLGKAWFGYAELQLWFG